MGKLVKTIKQGNGNPESWKRKTGPPEHYFYYIVLSGQW